MIVYLDESGDLGWKLDKPYLKGGSSKYLTLCCLLIPSSKKHLTKRIIKQIYKKEKKDFKREELKATNLSQETKEYFVKKVVTLLQNNNDIQILGITTKKKNVQEHIKQDSNKIYNYMTNIMLTEKIRNEEKVIFIPDPRSIKVESGNSLVDYLQTKLWFELNSKTYIEKQHVDSHNSLNLQFIDYIVNIVFSNFEFNRRKNFLKLKPHIEHTKLFFF